MANIGQGLRSSECGSQTSASDCDLRSADRKRPPAIAISGVRIANAVQRLRSPECGSQIPSSDCNLRGADGKFHPAIAISGVWIANSVQRMHSPGHRTHPPSSECILRSAERIRRSANAFSGTWNASVTLPMVSSIGKLEVLQSYYCGHRRLQLDPIYPRGSRAGHLTSTFGER